MRGYMTMLLTDYFRSTPDVTWEFARQCGVEHGTVRLPEDAEFDPACREHWRSVYKRFTDHGIRPVVIEPMPNSLHDHIKAGDAMRDECIDKVIKMFAVMDELDVRTICFNFMAYVGWTRTTSEFPERGGAKVTGFRLADYVPGNAHITEAELWDNYTYFIKAVLPEAEKHGIKLALHPDDPPIAKLGGVSRIMISAENMEKAVRTVADSPSLGLTFCQATYHMMGEDLYKVIPRLADKIMFVHFRNAAGTKEDFRETFHDNGELDMPRLLRLYRDCGVDVPIRVDHVPTMAGEAVRNAGYDALGRLYALGYLRGIMETVDKEI